MSSLKNGWKPTFWRSLAELENTPEFRELAEREFAAPPENDEPNSPRRRRFMQLMGASMALAGVATGCRWEKEKILPHTRIPAGTVPGVPQYFATSMELWGGSVGLLARSYDGRPVKLEGNPKHVESQGAASALHQAALLGLYDPDRATTAARFAGGQRTAADLETFDAWAGPHFAALAERGGEGLAFLVEESSSPTRRSLAQVLASKLPAATWHEYTPVSRDAERAGAKLAFGKVVRAVPTLREARVVVALDADFLTAHPSALRLTRELSTARDPEHKKVLRLYAAESRFTVTGGAATHRLPVRSAAVHALALALDARVSAKLGAPNAQAEQDAPVLHEEAAVKWLAAVVEDLAANQGASLVLAGPQQPAEVHALAHRLNELLGNVGHTVHYVADPEPERPDHFAALGALAKRLGDGAVDTLVILGGNPVYDAPADVDVGTLLGRAKHVVRLGLYEDETTKRSTWFVPEAHFLEAWGDGLAWDGLVTLQQPLIAPLYGGRSAIELLAQVLALPVRGGRALVQQALGLTEERRMRRAVHDGFVAGTSLPAVTVSAQPLAAQSLSDAAKQAGAANGAIELQVVVDAKVHDGRFANNAWLQEFPDPINKLTWDNALLVSPKTARDLGLAEQTLATVTVDGRTLTLPVMHAPGQAAGTAAVALGYGRTEAGHVAGSKTLGVEPVGQRAATLRTAAAPWVVGLCQVSASSTPYALATTQHLHAIDQLGQDIEAARIPTIVRSGTLAQYEADPSFAPHMVHHPPLLNLWKDPVSYEGRKWGMSIDLTKCVGCGACVVACQAENNIPVVGKTDVLKGREMHWIRVDRYFKGDPESPEVIHQPLTCQQCENAPCEQVCPVGATMHSHEGLNDMVYNRCIGTRYCSNNCPYKVRRFNYFHFNLDLHDDANQVRRMALNPEVTVRVRGIMEKCTFCVQRIQDVKIQSRNARRPIEDGEIRTACQQTCPAEAIVFGDLNDPKAQVVVGHQVPRAYELLGEMNNRARVRYLARVTNPNPSLDTSPAPAGHGEPGGDHGGSKAPAHGEPAHTTPEHG